MVWLILILVVAPLLALVGIAAMSPSTFRVERRTHIDAAPARVFALIEDFHRWAEWSPWEALDPAMTRTHSGAASGRGAKYAWSGNKKVGEGRMEIIDATSPSRVVVSLEFLKPWKAHNTAEFDVTAAGGGSDVTWAMYGRSPLAMRVFGIFMPMDKLVGRDFERGLASMKAVAEAYRAS